MLRILGDFALVLFGRFASTGWLACFSPQVIGLRTLHVRPGQCGQSAWNLERIGMAYCVP